MGRGRHARRAGSGGGGGGSRSGRSSAGHGLSRTQQQEELVGNFPRPTAAYVYPISHRSHGSGSGSGSNDDDDYPYDECQYRLNQVYDAVRLCGSDCTSARMHLPFLKNVCGIRVLPDRLENKATDGASAAANR